MCDLTDRAEWYLREHGRFPTPAELVAIRRHLEADRTDRALGVDDGRNAD